MKITIVGGFFLPIPALAGGAHEKTWTKLSEVFAREEHEVTVVSRTWQSLPQSEVSGNIRHFRIRGYDHSTNIGWNLLKDFRWSLRLTRRLPTADIVVVNPVSMPIWLRRVRPQSGRLVIMTGRVPKGQYRFYHDVALALAASSSILAKVALENPQIGSVGQVYGYPIDYAGLSGARLLRKTPAQPSRCELGFIGRIHREKGIEQLVEALRMLEAKPDLPPWRFTFCGPTEVSAGGSGAAFLKSQVSRLSEVLPADRFRILPPCFNEKDLAQVYADLDVFVLPSLAERGETFGVAAVEAMAAGCAVITSSLSCFSDYLQPDHNGLAYNHRADDAPRLLAEAMAKLISDQRLRCDLSTRGQQTARSYDFEAYGQRLLVDFTRIQKPQP